MQALAARKQVRKFRRFCEAEEVERSPLGNVLRMSVPREERSAGRAGPAFKRLPARLRGLPQVDRPCEIAVRRPGTGLHINGVSSKSSLRHLHGSPPRPPYCYPAMSASTHANGHVPNGVHVNGTNGVHKSRPLTAGIYAPIPTFFLPETEDLGKPAPQKERIPRKLSDTGLLAL